jgi:glyoxylase I family protein
MFEGLEHTAIASLEPRKLAQWYVDHLGFRINHESGGGFFIRAANGGLIEIIPARGTRTESTMHDPGLRHLAIGVSDFDRAHAALREKGVHFLGEPYTHMGNRLVFFTDCDGNLVHLIQRERPLP